MPTRIIIFRPLRLLWLVPVMYAQMQFVDPMVSMLFGATLAFLTVRLFPPWEQVVVKDEDDENKL